MSIRWKPQCVLPNPNYTGDYWNKEPKTIHKVYDTYRELKKNLPELIEQDNDPEGLFVLRSRRGEWGEWFERWKMINGKPQIIKEGWS
jgi:hypothetical protein